MATDKSNVGFKATLGQTAKNRGGKHSGTDRGFDGSHSTPGQEAGNPGTALPWEGSDATPKPGQVPPLKSL